SIAMDFLGVQLHFTIDLFNTLNTMARKAQMSDNPELYQMIISLGDLLKTNMLSQSTSYLSVKNNEPENSGGKPVENLQKLSEELKYIKLYIYLQKMRFEDKIDVHFEIDPNLEEYRVPYFCIQTLVENAFVHGLEAKKGKGNLTIIIKKNTDSLFISVQDDGVGFQKIPDLSTTLPP
ncbi:MAG: histidine kinase, partial [Clostridiales bacterium]|nr:histidine kinase [Clostridiales bacterium]